MVVIKLNNLNYEEAAAIPFGVLLALYFLKKANIQSGQSILIYGASGAIGTLTLKMEDLIFLKKLIEEGKLKPTIDRILPMGEFK